MEQSSRKKNKKRSSKAISHCFSKDTHTHIGAHKNNNNRGGKRKSLFFFLVIYNFVGKEFSQIALQEFSRVVASPIFRPTILYPHAAERELIYFCFHWELKTDVYLHTDSLCTDYGIYNRKRKHHLF